MSVDDAGRADVALPLTYLYVPGVATDKLSKALNRGADALIIDLEDAVPEQAKATARASVVGWLQSVDPGTQQVWVRINSGDTGTADVAALVGIRRVTGLVMAKTESPEDVARVADALNASGDQSTLLMPLLETARAILEAPAIARQQRVHRLQIGEVDLCADTGLRPDDEERELAPMRTQVVLASAAAGISPPVGAVDRDFADLGRLEVTSGRLRRQGFVGRCCIHPAQLAVVKRVFTPSGREAADAARVVAAFDAAVAAGSGVLSDGTGKMVDLAVIRQARRTLAAARPTD